MSKVKVEDVLKEIEAPLKDNGAYKTNRFNKKSFTKLMKAMMDDPDFTTTVANVKKAKLESVEEIKVSQLFRGFCKKLLEKAGVDKAESARVLTEDFTFDSADGLYEFFATAMYLYISKGNRFDLIPKEDFKGSIALKEVAETTKDVDSYSPQTREHLGKYTVKKKKHKVLSVKSACPSFLRSRIKIG